jgi:hypothetical protein
MRKPQKPLNPGVIVAIIISILVGTGVIGSTNSTEPSDRFVKNSALKEFLK